MRKFIDEEFHTILSTEILNSISKAVNSIHSRPLQIKNDEIVEEIIDNKIDILRDTVLWYIENQRTVIKKLRKLQRPIQ